MRVVVDNHSGFCFGVVNAIKSAERELSTTKQLYCLGEIVHNEAEVLRLEQQGLQIISSQEFSQLRNVNVLIRAHGEPPETYLTASANNIRLIDASCPVVLRLQKKIKKGYESINQLGGQLVIYGKKGHAEVNGLVGQVGGNAIIIENEADISRIDFNKPVMLFSQTTKSIEGYNKLIKLIQSRFVEQHGASKAEKMFIINNTICKQVANRFQHLRQFVTNHDLVFFVSGKSSSNGNLLYNICKAENPNTFFISEISEIDKSWFTTKKINSVGICGATSTPQWQMDDIAKYVSELGVED